MDFIVGRYEAGIATLNKEKAENGTEEEKSNPFDYTVEFTDKRSLFQAVKIQTGLLDTGWTWQNYAFTARRTGTPVTTGSNKASRKCSSKSR